MVQKLQTRVSLSLFYTLFFHSPVLVFLALETRSFHFFWFLEHLKFIQAKIDNSSDPSGYFSRCHLISDRFISIMAAYLVRSPVN